MGRRGLPHGRGWILAPVLKTHTEDMSTPLHLVTIGDSTIDNLIWMDKDPSTDSFRISDCVIGQLRTTLPEGSQVTNLAADGFTSSHVLHGAIPMLSSASWERAGEPFPCQAELVPLDELEGLDSKQPVSHVLLSVGGNDVRVILQQMHRLPEVVAEFHSNYQQICDRILALDVQLIIMLQYQVCLTHEFGGYGVYAAMDQIPGPGTGQQKLQQLMAMIYAPVIDMAKQHGLAVIDLPRTFDPADAELYRLQIEPSAKGSTLIAAVVAHAIESHDASSSSMLYSQAPDGCTMRSEENMFSAVMPWTIVRDGEVGNAIVSEPEMQAAFSAQRSHVEALPHAVKGLVDMGFDEEAVKVALAASGNVPQQALELLLEQ